eukprot:123574-Alexandrium_andersonii.AAC.1
MGPTGPRFWALLARATHGFSGCSGRTLPPGASGLRVKTASAFCGTSQGALELLRTPENS